MVAKKLGSEAARENAFTLAEVLITLAIIGVVAALTIPTVVAKYQKKQYYTQFMKMYNTLSNALTTAQAEHGPYNTWGASGVSYNQFLESYFVPNLKISKKCNTQENCGISDTLEIKPLNEPEEEPILYKNLVSDYTYLLADGTILMVMGGNFKKSSLFFDTNGIKGPNIIGRDFFSMNIGKLYGKYVLTNEAMSDGGSPSVMLEKYKSDDEEYNCTMEYTSSGSWCPARLLLEGKMDY